MDYERKDTFEYDMEKIKKDKNFKANQRSISIFLYYMGQHNLKNEYILNQIDLRLSQFKNSFNQRQAQCMYQAALKCSLPKHFVYYTQEEYLRHIKNNSDSKQPFYLRDCLDILEGLVQNTILSVEEKRETTVNMVEPIFKLVEGNKKGKKFFKYFNQLFKIKQLLYELDQHDLEIFKKIQDLNFENKRYCKNLDRMDRELKLFDTLIALYPDDVYFKDSKKKVQGLIKENQNFTWLYNLEE